ETRHARAQPFRWLHRPMAFGGEAEFLHRLAVEMKRDLGRIVDQPHRLRAFEIGAVGVLVVELLFRQAMAPETVVFDITADLVRVRRAAADCGAVLTAEAGERADAGLAL